MHSILLLRKSMGAVAARTAAAKLSVNKAITPHVPLIKFPGRGSSPVLKEVVGSTAGKPVTPETALNTAPTTKDPPAASRKSSGTILDSSQLPQKYRRKPISKEEMEFIEKGGPV